VASFSSLNLTWGLEETERSCSAVTVIQLMIILWQKKSEEAEAFLYGYLLKYTHLQKENTEKYCNGLLKGKLR